MRLAVRTYRATSVNNQTAGCPSRVCVQCMRRVQIYVTSPIYMRTPHTVLMST
jgi:hypothetical protein